MTDDLMTRTITSAADLLAAYAAGRRDFFGADLCGADLCGADLRGADLRGADLRGADLGDAYLGGADLRGADLCGADLCGADLGGAENIPTSSHDAIAELLRQAAGARYDRRQVAGLVLVSRDWCWSEFSRVALAHWPVELRRWIVVTLSAAGEQFAEAFREHLFLTADELASTVEATAEKASGGDGA